MDTQTKLDFFKQQSELLRNNEKIPWRKIKQLPKSNGVYILTHPKINRILYVGESKNIYDRIYNHHNKRNGSDLLKRMEEICEHDLQNFLNECYIQVVKLDYGRSELEEYLIDTYKPLLNNRRNKPLQNLN